MSNKSKTHLVGRNANTGRLTSVATARSKPSTHVVERMPNAGYGDTGNGGNGNKNKRRS